MMQKRLITTASAIALLFGAATTAAAQDRSAPTTPDPSATPSGPASPGAGAIQREGGMNDPAMQQRRTSEPAAGATGATGTDGSSFQSYNENKDAMGSVTIAGGLSADQLIGGEVLNASGDEVGEIEDLIVESDNTVNKAIVQVGGFLGMGAKYVAVDLAQLKHGSNEQGFVTSMTKEELETLPQYKKESGAWVHSYEQ